MSVRANFQHIVSLLHKQILIICGEDVYVCYNLRKNYFFILKLNSSGSSGYSSGSSQQSSSSSSSTLDSKDVVETNGGKWVWSEVRQKYEWEAEAGAKQVRSPHFNLCTDPVLIYWSDNRIHLGLSNSGFSPPPLV